MSGRSESRQVHRADITRLDSLLGHRTMPPWRHLPSKRAAAWQTGSTGRYAHTLSQTADTATPPLLSFSLPSLLVPKMTPSLRCDETTRRTAAGGAEWDQWPCPPLPLCPPAASFASLTCCHHTGTLRPLSDRRYRHEHGSTRVLRNDYYIKIANNTEVWCHQSAPLTLLAVGCWLWCAWSDFDSWRSHRRHTALGASAISRFGTGRFDPG